MVKFAKNGIKRKKWLHHLGEMEYNRWECREVCCA